MIMLPSFKARQRVMGLLSAMFLIAVLMLPLACASTSQQRSLSDVKEEIEATWILEKWHMKGETVRPPKVEGRFVIRDDAFVLILLNRAGEPPWSYYGYGKYTLDASTFAMGFDEEAVFLEETSRISVSRKPTWEGMKPFGIETENNQLHMRPAEGGTEIIVDGNTLIIKKGGKISRTYRRAGTE